MNKRKFLLKNNHPITRFVVYKLLKDEGYVKKIAKRCPI